jgi:hypothetical protein
MAIVSAIFTFALPDDVNSDKLRIYRSNTETGSYALDTTFNYTYGYRAQEYDSVDDTKWYKIQFYNSVDDEAGPMSDPVYGGDFGERDTPFLALSSSFDGAYYASATDVFNLTGLTLSDISVAKVQSILRSTRAYIDLRLDSVNLSKFRRFWGSSDSRRKYNATLRVIKDVETNLAASVIFRSLSDDEQLGVIRGTAGKGKRSISIGSTSITSDNPGLVAETLNELSVRYASYAASLFNSIMPSTTPIAYSDNYQKGPLFIHPADATGNIYVTSGNIGSTFNQYTADLTGLGDDFNGVSYSLNGNAIVEGQTGQSVDPLEAQSAIVDAELYVNGVLYHLDDWVDNGGNTQSGKGGTTGGTNGFSLDFSTSTEYVDIIWNNTAAAGGFDLIATDEVILKYWVLGDS